MLKKWLEGSITWQEERELEQLAQGDPMLADALAGVRALPESNHLKQVENLKAHLQERVGRKRQGLIFYLPRVAAAAAIVGTLSFGIWFLSEDGGSRKSGVENQNSNANRATTETLAPPLADVQAMDTNAALAIEDRAATPLNPGQETAPLIKPTVPKKDGVVVEVPADTQPAIADTAFPTISEDAKPDLAAKKAEAAPQAYEPAKSQARTRTLSTPMPDGRIISGKVTDASGEPLIGASIVVAGTNQGTVSDLEGRFKIELPKDKELLMISYVGYDSKEVRLDASDTVNLQLQPGGMALEEVVVTKYSNDTNNGANRSADTTAKKIDALAGKVPGVQKIQQPSPRGGFDKFKNYIAKNLRYPKTAQEAGIEGEVGVTFQILSNGKLTNFKIVKSLGYGLDEEAIRLLREGPRWERTNLTEDWESAIYTIAFELKK